MQQILPFGVREGVSNAGAIKKEIALIKETSSYAHVCAERHVRPPTQGPGGQTQNVQSGLPESLPQATFAHVSKPEFIQEWEETSGREPFIL